VSGGRDPNGNVVPEDTWIFDLAGKTWTQLTLANQPNGSVGCAMAYSATRHAIYFTGGLTTTGTVVKSIWRFDPSGQTWTLLPATGPSGRYDSVFVPLDDKGEKLILFGGEGFDGNHNDLWIFDTTSESWSKVVPNGTMAPAGRRRTIFSVQPGGGAAIMGMGVVDNNGPVFNDLWRFDFSTSMWQALTIAMTPPAARGYVLQVPGGLGSIALMVGGFDLKHPTHDIWRLWPPSDGRW
jgi:hypothetical protein